MSLRSGFVPGKDAELGRRKNPARTPSEKTDLTFLGLSNDWRGRLPS